MSARPSGLRPTGKAVIKGLLYANSYPVNEKISVVVPTVGQIIRDEDAYYSLISAVTATPSDFMVQLEDIGIDFASISSFELFLLLFPSLKTSDTSLVFGDLDLSKFEPSVNLQNKTAVLRDKENNIVIDRAIHDQICRILREINHLEKNNQKPANAEARRFMLERARLKQYRASRRQRQSQLEDLIIAMVNTEQYKYGYEGTLGLTIYQFHTSVRQIIRKISYDQTMIGYYAGTVNPDKIDRSKLNWLSSKTGG